MDGKFKCSCLLPGAEPYFALGVPLNTFNHMYVMFNLILINLSDSNRCYRSVCYKLYPDGKSASNKRESGSMVS